MSIASDTDPVRMYMAGVYCYCLGCASKVASVQPSAIRRSRMAPAHQFDCDLCRKPIRR